MKLITRDTDYAIRSLCFMAQNIQRLVSVSELVQKLNVPRQFLRRILQVLNKKKILNSFKGQGGGFRLAQDPKRIFIIDLIKIFQGAVRLNECILKKKVCPDVKECLFKKKIDKIERYVLSNLKSITVESLLRKDRG